MAGSSGMNAVGQIQLRHAAHAFQQKRHEGSLVSFGQIRENRAKRPRVFHAQIGRHHHAGDHDLHRRIFCPHAIDNRLQILFGELERNAAQSVVGAQFEKQNVDIALQQPVDAPQSARGRFAAQAGVDDVEIPAQRIDLLLNQRREGQFGIKPKAGSQAVAEKENRSRRTGGLPRWRAPDRRGDQGQAQEKKKFPHVKTLAHVFSGFVHCRHNSKNRIKQETVMDLNPMLHVEKLSKSFQSGQRMLTVLQQVSFALAERATCAIVGPSGSGKTTLLGLCAGLDRPSTGSVTLNGIQIDGLDEDERARVRRDFIGFVFQSFRLLPTLTALENVMVPLELRGETNVRPAAADWLERVGLADRMNHYPAQLSGGEQQRVALARAFINRPKILFADEPTGNLDADTSERVISLLFDLNQEAGTTLVLVTHNLDLARRTQRILRLRGGAVISDERTDGEYKAKAGADARE